ncbi:MAG: tetratricopeptide repeat protein [Acidobacteriota bacterium]
MAADTEWRRMDEVFQQARERPADRRAAYLDAACGDDPDLRSEIEALLAADASTGIWLDGSLADEALELLMDDADILPGTVVGSYRIVRPVGRGGMGVVYLAERCDGHYRQQVALKLIKRGMDTDELLELFRRERQILAQLDHPRIAHLLDGGAADDGRPYLVMDYVEGVAIDEYVRRHALHVEEILRLFEAVCEVVRFAHRNLVIHRDLKPSNILVAADGAPRLLDFGTAKLVPGAGDRATTYPLRAMTPTYASPEQIQGRSITTAADVFALGVLLYELLAGRHPFADAGGELAAVTRAVCEQEPARPSRVAPAARRRRLQGDLDAIIARAMRKDPAARYESVAALAEDVERHRTALPVAARRGTLRYRSGRFVRRHRLALSVLAAVLVVALVFICALVVEQRETRRAQLRAEAITDYLKNLFEGFDPFTSDERPVTARQMLDRGVDRLERELVDEPDLEVEILGVLGEIYANLGHRPSARDLLERALAVQERELAPDAPRRARLLTLLAEIEAGSGRLEQSRAVAEQALALLPEDEPATALERQAAQLQLAHVDRLSHRFGVAESSLTATLARLEALRPTDPALVDRTLLELGAIYRHGLRWDEARAVTERAVQRSSARRGAHDPRTILAREALAAVLFDSGDWGAAEASMLEILEARSQLLGDDHPELIASYYNLGALAARQGHYGRAAEFFEQSVARMRREGGHPHLVPALMWSAQVALNLGRLVEASALTDEVLGETERRYAANEDIVFDGLLLAVRVERARGRRAIADRLLDRLLGRLPPAEGVAKPRSWFFNRLHLARFALADGDLEAVAARLAEARALEPEDYPIAQIRKLTLEATLALRRGRFEAAETLIRSAPQDALGSLETIDWLRFEHVGIAVERALGRRPAALLRAREVLRHALDTVGDHGPLTGHSHLLVGLLLLDLGRTEEAMPHLERAVELLPAGLDGSPSGELSARDALRRARGEA